MTSAPGVLGIDTKITLLAAFAELSAHGST
jgi:hypothetical protein